MSRINQKECPLLTCIFPFFRCDQVIHGQIPVHDIGPCVEMDSFRRVIPPARPVFFCASALAALGIIVERRWRSVTQRLRQSQRIIEHGQIREVLVSVIV